MSDDPTRQTPPHVSEGTVAPAAVDRTPGVDPDRKKAAEEELVPTWLAVTILVLLLALALTAGYVIREQFFSDRAQSTAELDIAEWEEAVDRDPSDLQARLSLGFAYQQVERYDDALEQYDFVLQADPQDTAARYNTGVIYLETLRLTEAEEVLWDVLELEPTHALAAKQLGQYYAGLEQYRSLLAAVEPAAEARPEMADLQYLMGLAYENLGQPEAAIERYRAALTYAPDYPEASEGLRRLGVEQ
jgi:tetratricopeptide (TPR) repeat protein